MVMRSPRFWWDAEQTLPARLLRPAGALYGGLTTQRMRRLGWRAEVPVICVGNFVVGGAGKTPTAIAVAGALIDLGESPAFLSRGYGRIAGGPVVLRVDPERHGAEEAGDEPLLLARVAPTFVAADRRAAARAAVAAGATILVLDDGLQNPALAKDAAIAVVDGRAGVGNGLCIPAGPLRAPLASQWAAVSMLCVIGPGAAGEDLARQANRIGIPVLRAELRPDAAVLATLRGRPLYAFCGIGRPDKFFETLEQQSLSLVGRRAFPDHHPYREPDRRALLAAAATLGAELVTTEKDRVRLPVTFPALSLPVSLGFLDKAPLEGLIGRLRAGRVAHAP